MVVVGFFGIRRGAEIVAFTTKGVTTGTERGMRLIVRCHKNDPLGLGHVCLIPNIAALAKCSPLTIFKRWLVLRADLVKESKSVRVPLRQHHGNQ